MRASRAPRERTALPERVAPPAPWERRAALASLDSLATPEDLGPRETRDAMVAEDAGVSGENLV